MKKVQLKELEKQVLVTGKEALSVEHEGKLIGYYYPVNEVKEVKIAAEELEKAVENVMKETGWNEDELVKQFTENKI